MTHQHAPSHSTPEGREPESGEPQELFDALNLLLWHEVRVSNNRDGSVAAALVANRDEARRRVVAMFERASTLRSPSTPAGRELDNWQTTVLRELWNGDIELTAEQRQWIRQALDAQERAGAREDDAGGPPT